MGWNGSGGFNRLFSWVADKAAGLDISSTRMDSDTNDIATNGFGNCLTRDGQGQPTANLPMATFRHTGVGNGAARTDYASMSQAQDGLLFWTIAGGSADAITATYTPSRGAPSDGALYCFRATAANATTTPTFAPDSQTARTITRQGGAALAVGDIPGNLAEAILRYNAANTRYELLNPSLTSIVNATAPTGTIWFIAASAAPTGWLLMDDGTFGSATSGSSNSNSAANQALFTSLFNTYSDSTCPILTSTGSPTTRAGQGTAAAAWAANCRMTLPKVLGRALGVCGAGSGLTSRAVGAIIGEETHTLTTSEIPNGLVGNNSNNVGISVNAGGHIPIANAVVVDTGYTGGATHAPGTTGNSGTWSDAGTSLSGTIGSGSISVQITNSGGGAHNNMQPTSFVGNAIIKQ